MVCPATALLTVIDVTLAVRAPNSKTLLAVQLKVGVALKATVLDGV